MRHWLVIGLTALPLTACAQTTMTPGEWQQTIHVEVPGSSVPMPAHTVKQCVKPQSGDSIKSYLQQSQQAGCQLDDYRNQGNKSHWKVTCTGQQTSTTEGVFTLLNPKAYAIKMTTTVQTPAGAFTTHVTSEGKWLGPCK